MFELNAAVAAWRRRFAERADLGADDLDELEDHLREAVADLRARGLEEEEAFLVAARRLGDADALGGEIAGAGPDQRRRLRLRWLALGGVLAVALLMVGAMVARMTPYGVEWLPGGEPVFTPTRLIQVMIQLGVLAVGGLLVWRLLTGDQAARRVRDGGIAWVARVMAVVVFGGAFLFFLAALLMRLGAVLRLGPAIMHGSLLVHVTHWLPVLVMLIVPVALLLLVWRLTEDRGR